MKRPDTRRNFKYIDDPFRFIHMPFQLKHAIHLNSTTTRLFKLLSTAAIFCWMAQALPIFAQPYFVDPAGNDANPGTLEKPFSSLGRAQLANRQQPGTVFLRGGTYY